MRRWRTLAVVAAVVGTLTACAPNETRDGGGGGPQPMASDRLPDSNNVNPSPRPDTFIDEESRRFRDHRRLE